MLNPLSEAARKYRARALAAWSLADATTDPYTKRRYLDFAWRWLDRALGYEAADSFVGKR